MESVERTAPELERLLREQARYYEHRAPEYEDVWFRRGPYDLGPAGNRRWFEETARLEARVDALDASRVVLELACGTGIFTRRLAPRARRLIALDAAASTLEINRRRLDGAGVEYVHGDLFEWDPPQGARFDLIFFAFLISHIPPARFEEFWSLLATWIAPGGRVFFCDDVAGGESRPSNPGEGVGDGPDFAHRRKLLDGREYTIVKVFHQPDGLRAALASLGWDADIRTTGPEFYYGIASLRGTSDSLSPTAAVGHEEPGADSLQDTEH